MDWLNDDTTTVPALTTCERCKRVMLDPVANALPLDKIVPNVPDVTFVKTDEAGLRALHEEFEEYLQRIDHGDAYIAQRHRERATRFVLVHTFGTVERYQNDHVFHAQIAAAEQMLLRIAKRG